MQLVALITVEARSFLCTSVSHGFIRILDRESYEIFDHTEDTN